MSMSQPSLSVPLQRISTVASHWGIHVGVKGDPAKSPAHRSSPAALPSLLRTCFPGRGTFSSERPCLGWGWPPSQWALGRKAGRPPWETRRHRHTTTPRKGTRSEAAAEHRQDLPLLICTAGRRPCLGADTSLLGLCVAPQHYPQRHVLPGEKQPWPIMRPAGLTGRRPWEGRVLPFGTDVASAATCSQ